MSTAVYLIIHEIWVTTDQNRNLELQPSNHYGMLISQKIQCLIYHANQIGCLPDSQESLDDHLPFRPTLRVSTNAMPEHELIQPFHRPVARIRSDVVSRDSGRQRSLRQQSA
jgi:hypothetical protein